MIFGGRTDEDELCLKCGKGYPEVNIVFRDRTRRVCEDCFWAAIGVKVEVPKDATVRV